ncbi:putative SUN domain-containing protein 3 [Hypsibius exemplaris]|uniref:SUN domain-containing protein 3 n=1 Tax=Hypsibius exemplaris TaxID=2072580 RepID=A0A1W0X1X2_HYPEX|nr:putative SUN domain-containing protein 3 [Hypsibius exemplaris]
MFRRMGVKYGHERPRSKTRPPRPQSSDRAESPVDLSQRGRRSRSGSLKRRNSASNNGSTSSAPEDSDSGMWSAEKERILPPAPDKSARIYGGRLEALDAPAFFNTGSSFDFYPRKRDGIWLSDADLKRLFGVLVAIFFTSLLVAFTTGYVGLSRHHRGGGVDSSVEYLPDASHNQQHPLQSDVAEFCISEVEDSSTGDIILQKRKEFEPEIGFDFSLASLGAKILSTRDTKPVVNYDASLLGYSFWSGLTSDAQTDAPLQPILMPGRCWRFAGFPGRLVVELAENVVVTSFTLSHVLGPSVPKSRLKSAPHEFEVWGLQAVDDAKPHFFGNYSLSLSGPSSQDFPVEHPSTVRHPIVELKVLNNHGSAEYTCVYRFKVFGIADDMLEAPL